MWVRRTRRGIPLGTLSLRSATSAIGVDIGSGHARVAQVKRSGAGHALTGYGCTSMPAGAVIEGEIMDVAAVSVAIRDLMKRSGIRGRDVHTGVSTQNVVVRLIDLPYLPKGELEGAMRYQVQEYIPMPVAESVVDYGVLGEFATESDEHMMELLLVAARRQAIDAVLGAFEDAKLNLHGIEVASFALTRALLGVQNRVLPDADEAPVGLVHVGSGVTSIAVAHHGVTRFNRVSGLAGNTFTQAIANALNVPFDEAERLKLRIGLPDVDDAESPVVDGIDTLTARRVQEALEREANRFIAEVRRSFDYYLSQKPDAGTIGRVVVTGTGVALHNFTGYLEKGLRTEVVQGDPLAMLQVPPALRQVVEADRLGCAIPIGLAIGGLGQ